MRKYAPLLHSFSLLFLSMSIGAQPWVPILKPSRGIDWSSSGVGGIPERAVTCARLTPSANLAQINAALHACPAGQTVFLESGTYSIPGTIAIPGNVTLRGAGANRTILNATGRGRGYVVSMGSESVPYLPVAIIRGPFTGSTEITVSNSSGIHSGGYLVIAESNSPSYVSASGSQGNCDWCDGWTRTGELSRGQIVEVVGVRGDTIIISPRLYGDYTNSPIAVPFNMSATYTGVEDLQVYANNTGYDADFGMIRCAYCWVKGVESNYTDGDYVEILWGFRDEVRESYFSNSFTHSAGQHDSGIHLGLKTSASLVENNIVDRARVAFDVGWGAAGNVIAYNYTHGEFASSAPDVVVGGFRTHGAHPQYNLLEGNVLTTIEEDPIWGSSSHTTAFRNWVVGTNHVCAPLRGRGAVDCSRENGHFGFQAARAIQISYLGLMNNFVGNVLGSAQMQALTSHKRPLVQVAAIEYPAERSYDAAAYGWSFGYGPLEDSGAGSGCSGGAPPCHLAATSSSNVLHGNYNNIDGSIEWAKALSHSLPPSFYLSHQPAWWGSMPFPSTGPDIFGGVGPRGHSYGNPAQFCYLRIMGGSDGGAGSPRTFNANSCYGPKPSRQVSVSKSPKQADP